MHEVRRSLAHPQQLMLPMVRYLVALLLSLATVAVFGQPVGFPAAGLEPPDGSTLDALAVLDKRMARHLKSTLTARVDIGSSPATFGDWLSSWDGAAAAAVAEKSNRTKLSWQKPAAELAARVASNRRLHGAMTSVEGRATIRKYWPRLTSDAAHKLITLPDRPDEPYHTNSVGHAAAVLRAYLGRHRHAVCLEKWNPSIGTARRSKFLALPQDWVARGGLLDNAIRPLVEAWSSQVSEHYYTYGGIRIYEHGASLTHHFDGGDHSLSAIIPIWATGGAGDWPLQVHHPQTGVETNVTMRPGKVLLYEGARVSHGRVHPLPAGAAAYAFVIYRPVRSPDMGTMYGHYSRFLASVGLDTEGNFLVGSRRQEL